MRLQLQEALHCRAQIAPSFTNSSILDKVGAEDKTITEAKDRVFMILVIFSLITILIGALGFLFKCIKNRCFTCTYGIILLPTWIVVIVVGLLALAAATLSEDAINSSCLTYSSQSAQTISSGDQSVVISFDIYDALYVDTYMCSTDCPCKAGSHTTSWAGVNPIPVFTDTGTFTTYKECVSAPPATASATFKALAGSFTSQANYADVAEWISYFEDEFECAGICSKANYYWGKSVEAGRPSASCIGKIKENISSPFKGLAVATIICGLFLFFIFIMQYCLWKKD